MLPVLLRFPDSVCLNSTLARLVAFCRVLHCSCNQVLGVEIPDFETVKRNIEMLMDPNTEHATFKEFAYEWPKSLVPIYPSGATQNQNM